jgi:hypothetical protein
MGFAGIHPVAPERWRATVAGKGNGPGHRRREGERSRPSPPGRGTVPASGWKALRACCSRRVGAQGLCWWEVGQRRRAVERSRLADGRPCGPAVPGGSLRWGFVGGGWGRRVGRCRLLVLGGGAVPASAIIVGTWSSPGDPKSKNHPCHRSPAGASTPSRAASSPRRWSGGFYPPALVGRLLAPDASRAASSPRR